MSLSLATTSIVVLGIMLLGVLPAWSHSANWGYLPSGALGVLLIVIIVLVVARRI